MLPRDSQQEDKIQHRPSALFFKGLAMGVADVIPGVSGGTIAFISGIYKPFIAALSSAKLSHILDVFLLLLSFWSADRRRGPLGRLKQIHWNFLIPLGLGIVVALGSMAKAVPYLIVNYPAYTYAFFFGLIAFSAVLLVKGMRRDAVTVFVMVASAALTFWVMGLPRASEPNTSLWFIFLSGAVGICALVLPGISGAYILLLLGVYHYVLDALRALDLAVVSVFVIGMLFGILSFVRVLRFFLERYYHGTLAVLCGILWGSLRVLWPLKHQSPEDPAWLPGLVLCIFVGALIIYLLERVSSKNEGSATEPRPPVVDLPPS